MKAAKLLAGDIPGGDDLTRHLMSGHSTLTRVQTISLVLALKSEEEEKGAYVGTWFSTEPDPETVLELLLIAKQFPANHPFAVHAARYLISHEWNVSIEKLKQLALHTEKLARILAYSKLDTTLPDHRKLLEQLSVIEPDAKVRKELKLKLGVANEIEALS